MNIVVGCYECMPNNEKLREVSILYLYCVQSTTLARNNVNCLSKAFAVFIKYLNKDNIIQILQVFTHIIENPKKAPNQVVNHHFTSLIKQIFSILDEIGMNIMSTNEQNIAKSSDFKQRIDVLKVIDSL